ncbi:AlkA N-terminal domain-containing protein [Nocardioides ginkgobilobae]
MTTSAAAGAQASVPIATTRLDPGPCYAAVRSRDRRFDGVFWTAVRTTGIYCRPSCPARTPAAGNVTFHPTAASAQAAGYRACKRCLPDATPGSPEWDLRAGVAGRAVRLIADGVVDREGVEGLARRVGYTPRHLGRVLVAELGAGPLALARARRAQTARVLIETTDLGFADIAFAAGFSSVRQFNDTVREVYDASPTELRHRTSRGAPGQGGGRSPGPEGTLTLRLPVRTPFAASALLDFLAYHLVPGVETAGPGWYARTLDLPHGPGVLHLALADPPDPWEHDPHPVGGTTQVLATFTLTDLRDTTAAVERTRRLLDADCDPLAVAEHLGPDPVLGPLVARHPGLRVPGQVDGEETAIRTVIGQQVSVTGARTVTGRIVAAHGVRVDTGVPGLTHLFPRTDVLAAVDPETLPMPRARGRALVRLAAALAGGEVSLDRGPERDAVRERMLALRGIGPWTADYVAMRALAHPDVFLPTDVGVRIALTRLGRAPAAEVARADAWRPWCSYALLHLWQTLMPPTPAGAPAPSPAEPDPTPAVPED